MGKLRTTFCYLLCFMFLLSLFSCSSVQKPTLSGIPADTAQEEETKQSERTPSIPVDKQSGESQKEIDSTLENVGEIRDLTVTPKIVLDIDESLKTLSSKPSSRIMASFGVDFLTLERMATKDDSAALIVHGVVENVRFTERDAWPLVIYDFVVSEVFKGEIEAPCRISVVQGGGFVRVESYIKEYGTKGLSEEDIERGYVGSYSVYFEKKMPETGDEYVLFLNPAQDEDAMAGAYYPHAMYHGKYIRDPETGLFARTTNETGEHFDWVEFDSETGQISGEEEQPMSLDTIRARLKTALEK